MQKKKNQDLFSPAARKLMWWLLYGACAVSLLAALLAPPKAHFPFEEIFGFHAILGFASCAVLIIVAKGLGLFVKKGEDYYER
ncbi:hypothetical protein [Desulfohalovibrio reitneri]|uniref:hypothetical protein n=1 Tax=Desulfohalovibrio reitneri TaxID=1307759 RepID=UPI0004A7243D|nr:hypothetical protein [Desulfohalovibrio reitneri]